MPLYVQGSIVERKYIYKKLKNRENNESCLLDPNGHCNHGHIAAAATCIGPAQN